MTLNKDELIKLKGNISLLDDELGIIYFKESGQTSVEGLDLILMKSAGWVSHMKNIFC